MTSRRVGALLASSLLVAAAALAQPPAPLELITELRVHGNYSVPDADVLGLAGVAPGDRIDLDGLVAIAERIRASGRFDAVEVRKRYTSLTRTDEVALILVVKERPAASVTGGRMGRLLTTALRQTMFLPILGYTEGQGVTYGGRFTLVDTLGDRGTLSVPLTFGGTRLAGLELEKRFENGPVHVLRGGVSASRFENQHFRINDRRSELWVRADRRLVDVLRVSAETRWSDVDFGFLNDQVVTHRLGLQLDTRRDDGFPRDAVFVEARWQWLDPAGGVPTLSQPQLDARLFIGLVGQTVVAFRAQYQGASGTVPVYAQPLVGGATSVRGHRVGAQAGDRLAAVSAELRVPLNSPMSFGKAGVRAFIDSGAVFDVDKRLRKTQFLQGVGVGVFTSAAFINLQLDVGYDLHGSARVHFRTNVSF
ncbi:MAG: BamA/TamA family outer membrane protein [Acidobacteriota bacterium]|nr:BamA/TamA family outer membrane protein [Acidobacteriota bacterium]